MDVYAQIATKIIERQESIIGSLAVEQARQVPGLHVDWPNHTVSVSGDKVATIDELVQTYKALFGDISVEVSKEAAHSLLNGLKATELPATLK
jgi:hypothetical protein